jgi:hypothetical protein|tara:strand:+ start:329 stop:532 length:204 start_codon:yes stop_codon:yes gene_type:complete
MGFIKTKVLDVQEFVWKFFDEDGNFIVNKSIKTPNQLLDKVDEKFGGYGVEIAREEIFAIETADYFS